MKKLICTLCLILSVSMILIACSAGNAANRYVSKDKTRAVFAPEGEVIAEELTQWAETGDDSSPDNENAVNLANTINSLLDETYGGREQMPDCYIGNYAVSDGEKVCIVLTEGNDASGLKDLLNEYEDNIVYKYVKYLYSEFTEMQSKIIDVLKDKEIKIYESALSENCEYICVGIDKESFDDSLDAIAEFANEYNITVIVGVSERPELLRTNE